MDARYLNESDTKTICDLIQRGIYPFTVKCTVNGVEGTAFTYQIDVEGCYWGTQEPSEDAIRWAMAFLREHRAE